MLKLIGVKIYFKLKTEIINQYNDFLINTHWIHWNINGLTLLLHSKSTEISKADQRVGSFIPLDGNSNLFLSAWLCLHKLYYGMSRDHVWIL